MESLLQPLLASNADSDQLETLKHALSAAVLVADGEKQARIEAERALEAQSQAKQLLLSEVSSARSRVAEQARLKHDSYGNSLVLAEQLNRLEQQLAEQSTLHQAEHTARSCVEQQLEQSRQNLAALGLDLATESQNRQIFQEGLVDLNQQRCEAETLLGQEQQARVAAQVALEDAIAGRRQVQELNSHLQADLNQEALKNQALQVTLVALDQAVLEHKSTRAAMDEELKDLKKTELLMTSKYEQAVLRGAEIEQQSVQQEHQFKSEMDQVRRLLHQAEARAEGLSAQCDQERERIEKECTERQGLVLQVSRLEQELELGREALEQKTTKIEQLEGQVQAQQTLLVQYQNDQVGNSTKRSGLQDKVEDLHEQLHSKTTQMHEQLHSKTAQITKLNQALEEMAEEMSASESRLGVKEAQETSLLQQIEQLVSQIDTKQVEVSRLELIVENLKSGQAELIETKSSLTRAQGCLLYTSPSPRDS
eukprot:TRINITY_DN11705_c0_g1_i2.p1 TRINITY_DN11705_c0_g1~~TRINITY_DN11705_c0_g1_i2.p1  ORF type:complete len:481 (-),score=152.72 TRINITY_DN11705_c0_g1_i2:143-1585(-)